MNLDFLTIGGEGAVAQSPMEEMTRAAGARFEVRDGWNVAVAYGRDEPGAPVGWADVSHVGKLELQGGEDDLQRAAADCGAALTPGEAVRSDGAWWCRLTATRALVIGEVATARERLADAGGGGVGGGVGVVDVTSAFAALTLVGPLSREVLARFCALDLRPAVTPVRALRPGSIGRQPGILVCEAEDRYLLLFGAATAEYMWGVVADAGAHLGGRPIGVDALGAVAPEEVLNA